MNGEKVRIDEEIVIPKPRWFELVDVLSRMDELLEGILRVETEILKVLKAAHPAVAPPTVEVVPPAPPAPPTALRPMLVQEIKNTKYRNFTIDLSVARAKEPLGLRDMGIVGDTMTIIQAEAAFNYILNEPSNDPTPAEKGMVEDQFEIEEIYITNPSAPGKKALIRVNWNPYLIWVE